VISRIAIFGETSRMSAAEFIEQFKALAAEERAAVTKYVVEHDDSWIPGEFEEGMAAAAAGRFVDMEIVRSGAEPPPARPSSMPLLMMRLSFHLMSASRWPASSSKA
jgi:predicted transcriptional regulator